jgi:Gram-negative bacterial TonB protein C-terminal
MSRLAVVFLFAAIVMNGCSHATTPATVPAGDNRPASDVQLVAIEFGDHPDPNTGALRVIQANGQWPLDLDPLIDSVSREWAPTSMAGIRRGPLAAGAVEELEETTVRVLDSKPASARLSIKLDAAPNPIVVTVPINTTVVIGSEANGQRHAFVAVSVLDRATRTRIAEVFSARDPGVTPPVKVSGLDLTAPASARGNGQKGVGLEITVDARGNVVRAHAFRGRFLSDAAVAAVEAAVAAWKFKPGTANGKAVTVVMSIPVMFGR